MNFPWAICLSRNDAAALAPLRLVEGVEIAEAEQLLWVRGRHASESLASALRALPAVARFEWRDNQRLRPVESRIPSAQFPPAAWQPLSAWLGVAFPAAALPGLEPRPATLRVIRSMSEVEPSLLLTTLADWDRFTKSAPEIRLRPLRFAVNAAGQVLVQGSPLPAVPGQRFALHDNIAVPAGFAWSPAVDVEVLKRRLSVAPDDLVLMHEDGTVSRLQAEQFVSATRSAVRATAEAFDGRLE